MHYSAANYEGRVGDDSDFAGVGLASATDLLVLQVQFAPGRLPRQCEQIFMNRSGTEPETMAQLAISPSAQVHVAIPSPKLGLYGIRWTW